MVQLLDQPIPDQRIIQSGRTWQQFKLIQEGFANSPGIKLFYYKGTIEILMPGREHEMFSAVIALLLGIFLVEKDIEFEPTGSMDQQKEGEASDARGPCGLRVQQRILGELRRRRRGGSSSCPPGVAPGSWCSPGGAPLPGGDRWR